MRSEQEIVIVNCFDTYEHRVELLKQYFTAQGKRVRVITSDWRHFHKAVRTECPDGYEMIHAKPYTKNLSVQRLMSHHDFAQDAIKRVEELRPDLLWVLVPPNSLAKRAAAYKKNHPDTKLVLDLIDMWPETMPISRFKTLPPFSFWRKLRDDYVGQADAVVTECGLYHTLLRGKCSPEKLHTLYLARKCMPSRSAPELPKDRTALCYLGSINNIIDIPCIARIIGTIEGDVELHIIGDGEKRQELIDAASGAGANVVFHGKVYDPAEKQKILDRCHFGLNIMKESVFVGLTMKSMDYFECGLPIINNIRGDTWDFVTEKKIGVNYENAESLSGRALSDAQANRPAVRAFFEENFSEQSFDAAVQRIIDAL